MKNEPTHDPEIVKLVTDVRRRLHAFAECGFHLPKTKDFVMNSLQNIGFTPENLGDGGIVCELSGENNTSTVLLRADMDALPIKEKTSLPFRAENGHMHACGHDMHTAMLLGAAALLKKEARPLQSSVRLVFQAGEETLSGATLLKKAGVLDGVGAAFMLHTVPAVPYPTGTLLLPSPGIGAPAACFFEIEITGKSAHIGECEKGVDALRLAVDLYLEMHRESLHLGEDFLLSVGKFKAGDAPNIVPERAFLAGSFRSFDPKKMRAFKDRITSRVKTWGDRLRLSFPGSCPPLKNDPHLLSRLSAHLAQKGFCLTSPPPSSSLAAEDFAVLANRVPAVALAIAAGEHGRGYDYPLHHPRVLFDEDALPLGAAVYREAAFALGAGE